MLGVVVAVVVLVVVEDGLKELEGGDFCGFTEVELVWEDGLLPVWELSLEEAILCLLRRDLPPLPFLRPVFDPEEPE